MKNRSIYVLILLLAAVPWFMGNRYVFHLATMITIMLPLALSMNLMLKIGQLSIAQPAFMGIGAYGSALLAMRLGFPPPLAWLCAALLAGILAAVVGPLFLRIKGVYFVLLTYAFGEIINLIFQEWTSLFGGNNGLYGVPKFSILGLRLTQPQHYFVFGLLLSLLVYWVMRRAERSDVGAIFQSLNEDEMLARSIGSNALSWRIGTFAVSAFVAGLSGGLYAFYIGFLSPEAFGFMLSVDLIVINAIGGVSTVLGPVLGAILIVPLPEVLREAREYQLLIYGVCLVVFLIFFRQGLIAMLQRRKADA